MCFSGIDFEAAYETTVEDTGTAYPLLASEFTPGFIVGSVLLIY